MLPTCRFILITIPVKSFLVKTNWCLFANNHHVIDFSKLWHLRQFKQIKKDSPCSPCNIPIHFKKCPFSQIFILYYVMHFWLAMYNTPAHVNVLYF